jgi:uncharacterized membrane protein
MKQLGLAMLLGVASFAFAAPGGVNPLCSMIEALANNWGIITWLVVGILGVMVMAVGIVNLTAGKAAYALVVVIGGTVILVATYRLMSAAETQLQGFTRNCQAQIEVIHPVAKRE